jgi:hypothetical protein
MENPYKNPSMNMIYTAILGFFSRWSDEMDGIGRRMIIKSVKILMAALENHNGLLGRQCPVRDLSQYKAMGTHEKMEEKKDQRP